MRLPALSYHIGLTVADMPDEAQRFAPETKGTGPLSRAVVEAERNPDLWAVARSQ
jgi:hypothetical protein